MWYFTAEYPKHNHDTPWTHKDRTSVCHPSPKHGFPPLPAGCPEISLSSSMHSRQTREPSPSSQSLSHPSSHCPSFPGVLMTLSQFMVSPEPFPKRPNLPWLSQPTKKVCCFLEPCPEQASPLVLFLLRVSSIPQLLPPSSCWAGGSLPDPDSRAVDPHPSQHP